MARAKKAQLQELEGKFLDLVWYARKPPEDDPYWISVRPDIRRGAFASMMKVEGKYPEEAAALASDEGDWHHGFNSGALAALRLALGGDIEDFPELYT